jgi:hypothetical protein
VNLSELGSLDLFAKWLLRLVVTISVAIVCSAVIAVEIEHSKPRHATTRHTAAHPKPRHAQVQQTREAGPLSRYPGRGVSGMKTVVGELALSEVGIADTGFNMFVDQMSQGMRSVANLKTIKRFAANPNDTALFNAVRYCRSPLSWHSFLYAELCHLACIIRGCQK